MGLFKRRDSCVNWLTKLDSVYTSALRNNNARLLEPYLTRNCLLKMVEYINNTDDPLKGLDRYRVITFTLKKQTDEYSVYLKRISYKNINMGYSVTIPMGDTKEELWFVIKQPDGFAVADIKGV